jgi:hypothetical protein
VELADEMSTILYHRSRASMSFKLEEIDHDPVCLKGVCQRTESFAALPDAAARVHLCTYMAAISMGGNPVLSFGGTRDAAGTDAIGPAPTDQDLVITDISLSGNGVHSTYSACMWTVSLESETGATLGVFKTWSQVNYSNYTIKGGNISAQLQSGVRVPAGESLNLVVAQDSGGTSCSLAYTLSGYHVQP